MPTLSVLELEELRNYRFTLDQACEEHFLVAGEQRSVQEGLRRLNRLVVGSPWSRGEQDGSLAETLLQSLAYLLPEALLKELSSSVGAIRLESEALELPWEMVFPERVVARQGGELAAKPYPSDGDVALWAGATHPDVFPWSQPLEAMCRKGWERSSVEESSQNLLVDASVGVAYLVAGVSQEGELVYDDEIASFSRWAPRQIHKARRVCRCLFLHLVDTRDRPVYHAGDRAARELLKLGVESVVVTFWQPDFGALPGALQRFFQVLSHGTVAEAFQALRESFPLNDDRMSRWAFGLYGNPELKGEELVPMSVGSSQSATTMPKLGKADHRLKIVAGPEVGREIPIFGKGLAPGQRLVVGRPGLKRCQIEVQDPTLASEAFALEWVEGEAYVINLTKVPENVRVEGLPVHGRLHLRGSQSIRSGNSEFVFSPASLEPKRGFVMDNGKDRFQIRVVNGVESDLGKVHTIREASTVVGREGSFLLHDPSVSRQHLIILQREGVYYVSALGRADLVLNGVASQEECELRHGDRLVLSDTTCLLFSDSERLPVAHQ